MACEERGEPAAAPSLRETTERDKIKQTQRRSGDAHVQIAILHGGFEDPAVPQCVQSAHSGSRRSRGDAGPLPLNSGLVRHGSRMTLITPRPLRDSWGRRRATGGRKPPHSERVSGQDVVPGARNGMELLAARRRRRRPRSRKARSLI